jgi:hypothetical protein
VRNTAIPLYSCLPALHYNGASSTASLAVAITESFVNAEHVMIDLFLLLTRIMMSSSLPLLR